MGGPPRALQLRWRDASGEGCLSQVTSENQTVVQYLRGLVILDLRQIGKEGSETMLSKSQTRQDLTTQSCTDLVLDGVLTRVGTTGLEWGTGLRKGAPGQEGRELALGQGLGLPCVLCHLPLWSHEAEGPCHLLQGLAVWPQASF